MTNVSHFQHKIANYACNYCCNRQGHKILKALKKLVKIKCAFKNIGILCKIYNFVLQIRSSNIRCIFLT